MCKVLYADSFDLAPGCELGLDKPKAQLALVVFHVLIMISSCVPPVESNVCHMKSLVNQAFEGCLYQCPGCGAEDWSLGLHFMNVWKFFGGGRSSPTLCVLQNQPQSQDLFALAHMSVLCRLITCWPSCVLAFILSTLESSHAGGTLTPEVPLLS